MENSRDKKIILAIILLFSFFIFLTLFGLYYSGLQPVSSVKEGKFKIIEIKKGENIFQIAKNLKKQGIIRSSIVFIIEAIRTGVYKHIKAGEYAFYSNQNIKEILQILKEGKIYLRKIVIPEGATLWQIAKILEKNKICKAEEFLKLAEDEEIAKKMGVPTPTLEGFLFPDTYFFAKNTPPETVIKVMVSNFWKNWEKFEPIAKEKNLSLKEVIILASIVEREALYSFEKPIIAGVYWNRIRKGMRLQADPTVNYALKCFRRLTYKDYYSVRSPYNTYLHYGLPPTPICNPGKESIKAVLFPKKVPYFYFVAKPDGTHYFSRTYKEHLKAIKKIKRLKLLQSKLQKEKEKKDENI